MNLTALASLGAGFALGAVAGYAAGGRLSEQRARFWVVSLAVVAVGMALDFAGLVMGRPWLAYGALGATAGAITGLRYGYLETARLFGPAPSMDGPEETAADGAVDEAQDPVEGDAAVDDAAGDGVDAHEGPAAG